jgi:hypothetical protein
VGEERHADETQPACVRWSGDLSWPTALPQGTIIDCSGLTRLGSWACAWFRAHPTVRVVAAPASMKSLFQALDLPILWYDSVDEARQAGGVTPSERAMLWS